MLKTYGFRKEDLKKLTLKEYNSYLSSIMKIESFINGNIDSLKDEAVTIDELKNNLKKAGITPPKGL